MTIRLLAAGALALVAFLAGPALAQTPAPTTIDFGPLLREVVMPFAVMLAGVLATWLSVRLAKWLGLKSDEEVRKYLEPVLQNALAYAQAKLDKLPTTVATKNEIVAVAANFAIAHAADGLKFFKLDQEAVERMLRARLEANVSAQMPAITATAAAPMPTTVATPAG